MANSTPFLSGLSLSVTLDEEAVNLAPQLIDADVTFFDADNNFNGGTLALSSGLSEDILAIHNEGTDAGQIGLSGADVTYGGTVIGTVSGGTGGTALQVTFNAQATSVSIERLVENLTFQNLSDTPAIARALELTITDAAGAVARPPVAMQAANGAANPFNGIDVGSHSVPALADLDGDGDLDAVVGERYGTVLYYENTGTALAAAYVVQSGPANPFNGVGVGDASVPALGDLDGDGDVDAVIGAHDGTLRYFENTGTALAPAYAEQTGAANPFSGVDVGYDSRPALADLDGDGDLDVAIGIGNTGTLVYYKNTGSGVTPAYAEQTGAANLFDGIDVGFTSTPAFADLDGDGDLDAVIGESYGNLNYYANTGTRVAPAYIEQAAASPFNGMFFAGASAPAFGDLDGDGDLDLVTGNAIGMLSVLENTGAGAPLPLLEHIGSANPFNGVDVGDNSKPALADLDGDGDLDAVVGELFGTLKYFENTGTALAPAYVEQTGTANPFNGVNVGIFAGNPAFRDLDGDADLDAVVGQNDGTLVYYRNTGTALAPEYAVQTGAANPFDGFDVGSGSAPALADLDGDGDLDAVVGEGYGTLRYYLNTGTALAPAYVEQTGAANPFNGVDVGYAAAPALADLDADGDLDAVVGDTYGQLYRYFENTGTAVAAAYVAHFGPNNPLFGDIDVGNQSTPVLADLDGDGDFDLVVGEMDGNLNYYENIATVAAPEYAGQTGAANPFDGIDAGFYSTPALADLDGDGDLDAVVGELYGALKYYKNTGTALAPAYAEQTGAANPFDGIDVVDRSKPALADLDGDGDLDVVSGVSGVFSGTLKYYKNTGTVLAPAYAEQAGAGNPFDGIDVGSFSAPALADLDGDGDLDAVVGEYDGNLNYYKNTGTALAPAYVEQTGAANPFNGFAVGYTSAPVFADLDGDGDLDAVVGEYDGNLNYYENTGTALAPAYLARTGADNPFDGIDVGLGGTPALADLDGDGDLDAVVGEAFGALKYYENTGLSPDGIRFVLKITQHADPSEDADVMNGTSGDDSISALGGNDTLDGGAGNDTLVGGDGADSMVGGSDDDTLEGGAGNDTLDGGAGNDTLAGGADIDSASYASAGVGVTVSLALQGTGQNTGGAGNDTLNEFENLTGSGFNDMLTGDANANGLDGGAGNDTLDGGAGNDTLDGGAGDDSLASGADIDSASYASAGVGVTVSLALQGTGQNTGGAGNDTLTGFENVKGSLAADSLTGDGFANVLDGSDGNDTLDGGAGNDMLAGGAGADSFVFAVAPGSANADHVTDFSGGGGEGDKLLLDASYLTDLTQNGALDPSQFLAAAGPVSAATAAQRILYDETTGEVYYDADGSDAAAAELIFTLDGAPTLAASDISAFNVNNPPVAGDDTLSATEDTPVTYLASDLVGNDTDVDLDTLFVSAVDGGEGAVLNGDGTVTFTPGANFNGPVNFNYVVSDGNGGTDSAAVTVNVSAVNDAPVAGDDTVEATEDAPLEFAAENLVGNDTDAENDALTVTAVSGAVNGTVSLVAGQITFTPDANFNGTASFDYTVSDGTDTDSGAVTVNVAAVNDAPVALDDTLAAIEDTPINYTVGAIAGNDSDDDDDTLFIDSVTSGTGGTAVLELDGTVTFTPTLNYNGVAGFTYVVSDGNGGTDSAAVTVNVSAVNDAPTVANAIADQAPTQINNAFTFAFAANTFADVEGDSLTYTATQADDSALPAWLTFTPGSRSFSGTPLVGDIDVIDVKVTANDGNGGTLSEVFTITVVTDNDTITGGAGDDALSGGTGDDSLTGGLGNDNLQGNAGIDTLIGNAGNDTLDGGADNDLAYGSTNDDSILGGAGIDTLVGNAGNDTINGGTEDDQVFGSVGDDYVLGGLGADVVGGNAGNDTVIGGDGTGTDTADGNDSLDGGAGNDSLFGGFGADLELAGAGLDTLIGNAGNDTLDGGADGDLVYGSAGDDSIVGSAGIDTLVGNANNDTLDGGADDDQVFGSIGDDVVAGGAGNDVVSGNAGDDTIAGGAGNDTMQGNIGTDTFRYDAATLNTGDVAAGQADAVTASAAGDLISMLGLNDELTINGTALSALTANAAVGNALNATNNIAFTGGVLQIDLDGNDTFNALNDFQLQLTGVTTVTYNATSDLFQLS